MKSKSKTVTAYLDEIPTERKNVSTKLREICTSILVGYEESMDYGMPCYKKDGIVEVAFASQKNYLSLYILKHEVLKKNKQLLQGLSVGKSCIRYSKPDEIDFQTVSQLLSDTVNSKTKIC